MQNLYLLFFFPLLFSLLKITQSPHSQKQRSLLLKSIRRIKALPCFKLILAPDTDIGNLNLSLWHREPELDVLKPKTCYHEVADEGRSEIEG